jgi:hypothetical protein
MAIPSRQIGQSTQANLLWQISKQLERLICVAGCGCSPTTTTTTIPPTTTSTTTISLICNSYSISSSVGTYFAQWIDCEGNPASSLIFSGSPTYNLCARVGTLDYAGDIVDNGLCI